MSYIKHFLERSRYIVFFGILGTFLASLALFLFGFVSVITSVVNSFGMAQAFGDENVKQLSIALIQSVDVFLLATVLYIVALGLYELFIDDALELPNWLEVHSLDDLKARLLGVIVVILPVTFLGKLVDWKQGLDILWLGLSVAVVLLAIAAVQFVVIGRQKNNH